MEDDQAPIGGDTTVRYLRWLVTILTVTMIGGLVTITALLVMRLGETDRLDLPDTIVLPDGARAAAFTQGAGWYAIVTDADEILVYSRATGALRQRVAIAAD